MKNTTPLVLALFVALCCRSASSQAEVSGELKKWHKVTLTFDGPQTSETAKFNPFLHYRLNVTFTHEPTGKRYVVPGYFAADGDAANTSADRGDKWRVHFAPDETGEWAYAVDFRRGRWAAVSPRKQTGKSGGFMDGETGSFSVAATDKAAPDFRARGRLRYVGEHYLQLAETSEWFLKCGADAPENFLAFADFDGTFHNDGHKDGLVKTWAPHLRDYRAGDPTWKEGKGKAILGALNYLASEGLNAVSFITMNVGGDDQNVFPYVDYDTWDRMDVSRLAQWEIVFAHAQRLGIFLHFKTMEYENQGLLDSGGVGVNTKLYYRELVARFGHHLALNWNVCEESGEWGDHLPTPPHTTVERRAIAQYIYDVDPYHHHLVIHNGNPFHDLLGPKSRYTGPSVQTNREDFANVHGAVLRWRERSAEAGRKWAVAVDEPGDASHSLVPDKDDDPSQENGGVHFNARKNALWGAFLAGAWGVEWYFGYKHDHSDLTCQDYRSRDRFWDYCRYLLEFFRKNQIPYWEMAPADDLTSTGFCLAKPGEVYVVYIPEGGTADVRLAAGDYTVAWFNPRTGGKLASGSVRSVRGGAKTGLGRAPDAEGDWVALVRAAE